MLLERHTTGHRLRMQPTVLPLLSCQRATKAVPPIVECGVDRRVACGPRHYSFTGIADQWHVPTSSTSWSRTTWCHAVQHNQHLLMLPDARGVKWDWITLNTCLAIVLMLKSLGERMILKSLMICNWIGMEIEKHWYIIFLGHKEVQKSREFTLLLQIYFNIFGRKGMPWRTQELKSHWLSLLLIPLQDFLNINAWIL